MDFTQIPKLVFEGALLPHLKWNDLLRLRRVCKAAKTTVDDYIRLKDNHDLSPEIEITENGERGFQAVLKMDIPLSAKIFFNNPSGYEFYRNKKNRKLIDQFLERFGFLVKHLRVTQISTYLCDKEWLFFDAFVNLQSLEAQFIGGWDESKVTFKSDHRKVDTVLKKMHEISMKEMRPPLPEERFSKLRTLKLGNHHSFLLPGNNQIIEEIFKLCISLEHVSLPFYYCPLQMASLRPTFREAPEILDHPMTYYFSMYMPYMRNRVKEAPSQFILKSIDFVSFHGFKDEEAKVEQEWMAAPYFEEICTAANELDIKLLNVGATWFQFRDRYPYYYVPPTLGNPVVSLVGIHPSVFRVDMPNLEKVDIPSSLTSCPGENWCDERPDWPSLKDLKIHVDSTESRSSELIPEVGMFAHDHVSGTDDLFQFFFQDVTRHAMTTLQLHFTMEAGTVAVPRVEEIVTSCPNLKKLVISNWPGTNKALTKFWRGLPQLEDVTLEYCRDLGNVAFVGKDIDNPDFLKLSKLQKLTLRGLDQMPKISDTLFTLVIRRIKLTHLILTSDNPLKSISLGGVRSLLEGDFALSIEKFPFENWSLENVSKEEFQHVGKLFRSNDML